MRKEWDVLLFGYYGFGNLGDELLAKVLVEGLETLGVPRSRMAVLSADPERSALDLGIAGVHRWHPGEVLRGLSRSRSLLFGGGGLFQDTTSWRSNLYYWGVVRLARMMGCLPWAFGQSLGPLKSLSSRFFAADAFRSCTSRVCRDIPSIEFLADRGMGARCCPDPVLALEPWEEHFRGEYLLVNIRPWKGDLPRRVAEEARKMGEKFGLPLLGVGFAPEDLALLQRLHEEGVLHCQTMLQVRTLEDVYTLASQACWALGMRFHFAILCFMLHIPITCVPYAPKVRSFAEEWGLPLWEGEGEAPIPGESSRGERDLRQEILRELRSSWQEVCEEVLSREGGGSS
jgi:polysaccharide pyruvyl transferase CsaB